MQRDANPPLVGLIAGVASLEGVSFQVEAGRDGFALRMWLSFEWSRRYWRNGAVADLWLQLDLPLGPVMVRFQFVRAVFRRAVFEAVEAIPGRDRSLPGPDALWLP